MNIIQEIYRNLSSGETNKVAPLVQKGLDEGLCWKDILKEGLFAGMEEVGRLFKEEDIFLPQVLFAAKAMNDSLVLLEPWMKNGEVIENKGKVILGTVKGDLHDLGKNLVAIMLKGAGFAVIDLGVDVSTEKFIETAKENDANIIAMSALLTTTMPAMRAVVDVVKEGRLGKKVKTMIGGCCVTQEYADKIGADGYAQNAGTAVDKAKSLLQLK